MTFIPTLRKKQEGVRGFTLIEMMVSVSLFIIVMMILTDLFLGFLIASRKAQSQKFVYDNIYSSIEIIMRHIRSGSDYSCAGGSCTSFSFTDVDGAPVTYRVTGGRIERSMSGGAYDAITAANVNIDNMRFYTFGDNVTTQPRVVIIIAGESGTGFASSTFNVQTTISQALLREF